MVKKLKLQEGKKTCPENSSQESSLKLCSKAKSTATSSQLVGQPSQEHGVDGNGEKGTQNVLECSGSSSAQGTDAVLSDLQHAGVFPPVLSLVLEEKCDWLEQNDQ